VSNTDGLFGEGHVQHWETDDEIGRIWRCGSKILLFTTIGRANGEPRTTS